MDLTKKLRLAFIKREKVLTLSDWQFIDDCVADYDDIGEVSEFLKPYLLQNGPEYRPTQEITDEEKQTILQSRVDRLFDKAGDTLQRFLKLAATPGYKMPEEGYKLEKTAGFANLSVDGKDEIRQLGDGPILSKEDPLYGTNAPKYSRHATQKVFQLFTHPEEVYSETTPIKIAGGFAFHFKGEKVIFSYSGGTPLQDQAIVIIGAHDAGRMSDEEFTQKQETLNNPYLTPEFLHDLNTKV
jgi:hypothetical protein